MVGDTFARPSLSGDREGLLGGFLGEVKVAQEADQSGEDAPPLLAEYLLERRCRRYRRYRRYQYTSEGRISTAPP